MRYFYLLAFCFISVSFSSNHVIGMEHRKDQSISTLETRGKDFEAYISNLHTKMLKRDMQQNTNYSYAQARQKAINKTVQAVSRQNFLDEKLAVVLMHDTSINKMQRETIVQELIGIMESAGRLNSGNFEIPYQTKKSIIALIQEMSELNQKCYDIDYNLQNYNLQNPKDLWPEINRRQTELENILQTIKRSSQIIQTQTKTYYPNTNTYDQGIQSFTPFVSQPLSQPKTQDPRNQQTKKQQNLFELSEMRDIQNQLNQIDDKKEIFNNINDRLKNIDFQKIPEQFTKIFIDNFLTLQSDEEHFSELLLLLNPKIRQHVYQNYFLETNENPYEDEILQLYFDFQVQPNKKEKRRKTGSSYQDLVQSQIVVPGDHFTLEKDRIVSKTTLFEAMIGGNIEFFPQKEINTQNYKAHFDLFCYGVKRLKQVLEYQKTLKEFQKSLND